LDSWLDDESADPRFILAAPAGRGKSALLVHWVQHLRASRRVNDNSGAWQLVFFPISIRFDTNRPEIFLKESPHACPKLLDESWSRRLQALPPTIAKDAES
jgi:hypothetical protein